MFSLSADVGMTYFCFLQLALHMVSMECDVIYILSSLSRDKYPPESNYKCIFLSQISNCSLDIVPHGSNTTLLFLPGKHILISNLTIKHCSYFTMKSSTGTSCIQRPMISCQYLSNFQFISITSVSINGLKFTGCIKNRVVKVDKFIIKDSSLVGKSLLPGRTLIVTQSIMYIIRSSFDSFNSPNCQRGGALTLIDSSCNISYSNFTNNNAYSGSAIWGSEGTTITIVGSTFHHNNAVDKTRPLFISGGTIYCSGCNITVYKSLFEHNKARFGGAILVNNGFMTINSNKFWHNTAEFGGALYAILVTKSYIYGNTTFKGNVAYYGAAAIIFRSVVTINGTLSIINNTAITGGIGIVYSTVTLGNNIVLSENVGSIFVYSGDVTITL